MDLVEFLLARIGEDEAVARAAKPGPWRWEGDSGHHGSWRLVTAEPEPEVPKSKPYDSDEWSAYTAGWERRVVADGTACDDYGAQVDIADADAEHIARWDPARVLAECEAKRRMVERFADRIEVTVASSAEKQYVPGAEDTGSLRLLALPYAEHPDYPPEAPTPA